MPRLSSLVLIIIAFALFIMTLGPALVGGAMVSKALQAKRSQMSHEHDEALERMKNFQRQIMKQREKEERFK